MQKISLVIAVIALLALQPFAVSANYGFYRVNLGDAREINIDAGAESIIEISGIPEGAERVKIYMKNKKDSNLVLLKRDKPIKKIKRSLHGDDVSVKVKAKDHTSTHIINAIFYKGKKVIGIEAINVNVLGAAGCSTAVANIDPVCGITYTEQTCPFEDSNICFFAFESQQETFTSLCEMEQAGAEYLHAGPC